MTVPKMMIEPGPCAFCDGSGFGWLHLQVGILRQQLQSVIQISVCKYHSEKLLPGDKAKWSIGEFEPWEADGDG